MRWLDSVIEATHMNLTQLWEAVEDRRAWCALVCGVTKSRTRLNNNNTQCPFVLEINPGKCLQMQMAQEGAILNRNVLDSLAKGSKRAALTGVSLNVLAKSPS